jgi:transcriptional regulator with XRE-family HTH domain
MAQVGGEDRSRTAIYLIEVGRSRPTPETLQLIAERTGKPIEWFLPGSSVPSPGTAVGDEESLDSLLRSGAYEEALEIIERQLGTQGGGIDDASLRLRHGIAPSGHWKGAVS